MPQDRPIKLDDIIEGSETLHGGVLSAPLVGYDALGALRYITAWDVHTTEKGGDDDEEFGSRITTTRLVFKFGDMVNG